MVAALVVPVSGPYTGTWNALPIGTNSDDGYELSATIQGQEVNETDAYGMTLVEAIYRGFNWRIRGRNLELTKTAPYSVLLMFGQTGAAGVLSPALLNIGDRWSKFCQTLVLTALLGNPPTTPQSLTALNSGVAPQSQSALLMTSKVRELPIEWVLLPYTAAVGSGSFAVPFTVT